MGADFNHPLVGRIAVYRDPYRDNRLGWWRFHDHYNRNGYCDDPARGY